MGIFSASLSIEYFATSYVLLFYALVSGIHRIHAASPVSRVLLMRFVLVSHAVFKESQQIFSFV